MIKENHFEVTKDGVLTRYSGSGGVVVIPAEIRGIPVKEIGEKAFFWAAALGIISRIEGNVAKDDAKLRVTIPESVTKIGDSAFAEAGLSEFIIPESVTEIGVDAFAYNGLKKIIIPDGVISIGKGAFSHNHLSDIVIPESVKEIGHGAFSGNLLLSIVIGSNVMLLYQQNKNKVVLLCQYNQNKEEYELSFHMDKRLIEKRSLSQSKVSDNEEVYELLFYEDQYIDHLNALIPNGADIAKRFAKGDFDNFALRKYIPEVSFYNDFEVFYNDNGKQAGTYLFDIKTNKWSIKND